MHRVLNEDKFDPVLKLRGFGEFFECDQFSIISFDKRRSKMHNFHQSDRIGLKLGRYS